MAMDKNFLQIALDYIYNLSHLDNFPSPDSLFLPISSPVNTESGYVSPLLQPSEALHLPLDNTLHDLALCPPIPLLLTALIPTLPILLAVLHMGQASMCLTTCALGICLPETFLPQVVSWFMPSPLSRLGSSVTISVRPSRIT